MLKMIQLPSLYVSSEFFLVLNVSVVLCLRVPGHGTGGVHSGDVRM